jgi:hypothetical protein
VEAGERAQLVREGRAGVAHVGDQHLAAVRGEHAGGGAAEAGAAAGDEECVVGDLHGLLLVESGFGNGGLAQARHRQVARRAHASQCAASSVAKRAAKAGDVGLVDSSASARLARKCGSSAATATQPCLAA